MNPNKLKQIAIDLEGLTNEFNRFKSEKNNVKAYEFQTQINAGLTASQKEATTLRRYLTIKKPSTTTPKPAPTPSPIPQPTPNPTPQPPTQPTQKLHIARQRVNDINDPELKVLTEIPTFVWLTKTADADRVADITSKAKAEGTIPMLCTYNMVNRDLGSYSAGGAVNFAEYENFIKTVAQNIKTPSIIVVEPDTLPQDFNQGRINSMIFEVDEFKKTGSWVFLDSGHSGWHSSEETATRLSKVVKNADGFALNVSNYRSDEELITYGNKVCELLTGKGFPNKKFIIDTSRNGNGPLGNEWCNPRGRALGKQPQILNQGNLFGRFYIKVPGESDGNCNGGPNAGEFWTDYAKELIRNSKVVN